MKPFLVEQDSLFDAQADATRPLAARLRPRSLDEVVGQQHLIGPGKVPIHLFLITPSTPLD